MEPRDKHTRGECSAESSAREWMRIERQGLVKYASQSGMYRERLQGLVK
jgi:hypothetical protein